MAGQDQGGVIRRTAPHSIFLEIALALMLRAHCAINKLMLCERIHILLQQIVDVLFGW